MKSIIKNVLREETKGYREKLKDIIEKQGIFSVVKILGGINNMKKVFMNDPEVSEILEDLTGVVDFTLYDHFKDRKPIVFTFRYEIIDVEENVWNTNSWPVINLIYDESKLTPQEKDQLMTILAVIINDNTEGKIITKFIKPIDNNYFYVRQINSKDVDIHDEEFPFSKEDVKRIHNKLYGESESLNESEKDTKRLFKIIKMIMEDMILPSYNHNPIYRQMVFDFHLLIYYRPNTYCERNKCYNYTFESK